MKLSENKPKQVKTCERTCKQMTASDNQSKHIKKVQTTKTSDHKRNLVKTSDNTSKQGKTRENKSKLITTTQKK